MPSFKKLHPRRGRPFSWVLSVYDDLDQSVEHDFTDEEVGFYVYGESGGQRSPIWQAPPGAVVITGHQVVLTFGSSVAGYAALFVHGGVLRFELVHTPAEAEDPTTWFAGPFLPGDYGDAPARDTISGTAVVGGPEMSHTVVLSHAASAYLYLAYADDDQGSGFSLTDSGKDFAALLTTALPIPTPTAAHFDGLWHRWTALTGKRTRTEISASQATSGPGYYGITAPGVTLTLADLDAKDGTELIIKDEAGLASLGQITITPEGGEANATIDGLASVEIDQDYGTLHLRHSGLQWHIL